MQHKQDNTSCSVQLQIDAFWVGVEKTLIMADKLWNVKDCLPLEFWKNTRRPPNPSDGVLPCLSREWMEGWAEIFRYEGTCPCEECVDAREFLNNPNKFYDILQQTKDTP
jgi:hypothetical protein